MVHHARTELLTEAQAPFELLWPYDLGADGIVIWSGLGEQMSLDSDMQANRSYWGNFSEVYGPMMRSFLLEAKACSAAHCSGPAHGRCLPHNSTVCECAAGWSGDACDVPAANALKADDGAAQAGSQGGRYKSLWNQPWPSWCKKESGVEPSGVDFAAFRITTNPNANHR